MAVPLRRTIRAPKPILTIPRLRGYASTPPACPSFHLEGDKCRDDSRIQCHFYSEDALFERIGLVVQKQLFEIGVDVEMVPATMSALMGRMEKGDYESVLLPMVSGRSLEWTYLFWRSVPTAQGGIIHRATRQRTPRSTDCERHSPRKKHVLRFRIFSESSTTIRLPRFS